MTRGTVARSFHYVFIRDDPELAIAKRGHEPELGKRLRAGGRVDDWSRISYHVDKGVLSDYLANNDAFRLCSKPLREVIDRHRGNKDVIQWLPALVTQAQPPGHEYWILHFPEASDVVDVSRSVYSAGRLVKPYLHPELVKGHQVFTVAHSSVSLIVADELKRAIQDARCSGVKFSRVPDGNETESLR